MDDVQALEWLDDAQKKIRDLNKAVDVAVSPGNANSGSYMRGMANGLLLAQAIMNGTEPKYLDSHDGELDFIAGVQKFNLAAGRTDDHFNVRATALHMGLLMEEFRETLLACNLPPDLDFIMFCLKALGDQIKAGEYDAYIAKADREELLDGHVDMMVIAVGGMMAQGANPRLACEEVNRANLAKLVNGVCIKDANGKIQKPEGWDAPNMKHYICKT